MVGTWIGGIIAIVVTLALAPEKAPSIHPAIAIILLVVGTYIAGFWGLVLAAPFAAMVVEIYRYMRFSTNEEKIMHWSRLRTWMLSNAVNIASKLFTMLSNDKHHRPIFN